MPYFTELFCGCSFPSIASRTTNPVIDCTSGEPISAPTTGREFVSTEPPGAIPALLYEADPADPIDMQLWWHLANVDRITARSVTLQRIKPGEYWLDGRRVRLRWGTVGGGDRAELIVREGSTDSDDGQGGNETPLFDYLRQVGDVAASLHGRSAGVPVVVRVPQANRLTFVDINQRSTDDPGEERVRSMKVACEQARLREQAAELYQRAEIIAQNSGKTLLPTRTVTNALPTVSQGSPTTTTSPSPIGGLSTSCKSVKPQVVNRSPTRNMNHSPARVVTATVAARPRSVTPVKIR